jgi:hypothetical protein
VESVANKNAACDLVTSEIPVAVGVHTEIEALASERTVLAAGLCDALRTDRVANKRRRSHEIARGARSVEHAIAVDVRAGVDSNTAFWTVFSGRLSARHN